MSPHPGDEAAHQRRWASHTDPCEGGAEWALKRPDMGQLPEPEAPRARWDVAVMLAAAFLTGLGVVALLAWRAWG